MPIPLAEALRRAEANGPLRKALGREALLQCCLQCERETCNAAGAGCSARQLKSERHRAYYAKKATKIRARARRYYREHKAEMNARSAEYQRDPVVLAIMAANRRARYAERAAAEGRTVRPYRWSSPCRNKPAHEALPPQGQTYAARPSACRRAASSASASEAYE